MFAVCGVVQSRIFLQNQAVSSFFGLHWQTNRQRKEQNDGNVQETGKIMYIMTKA
mgnify:CR=1 FL=1